MCGTTLPSSSSWSSSNLTFEFQLSSSSSSLLTHSTSSSSFSTSNPQNGQVRGSKSCSSISHTMVYLVSQDEQVFCLFSIWVDDLSHYWYQLAEKSSISALGYDTHLSPACTEFGPRIDQQFFFPSEVLRAHSATHSSQDADSRFTK